MALLDSHLIKQKHSYRWLLLFGLVEFVLYMGVRFFFRDKHLGLEEDSWLLDFYITQVVLHAGSAALMLFIYHRWKDFKETGVKLFVMFLMSGGTLLFYHFLVSIFLMGYFSSIGIEDELGQLVYIRENIWVDAAIALADLVVIIFWVYIGDELETEENIL